MTEEYNNLLDKLIDNLGKVKFKCEQKDREIKRLQEILEKRNDEINRLHNYLLKTQSKYEDLIYSKALVISEKDRNNAKMKISNMMREIDRCIAQLNEIE